MHSVTGEGIGLLPYGLIVSGFMFEAGLDSTVCFAHALSCASGLGFDSYNSITTIPTIVYLIGAFTGAVLSSSSIDEVPGGLLELVFGRSGGSVSAGKISLESDRILRSELRLHGKLQTSTLKAK